MASNTVELSSVKEHEHKSELAKIKFSDDPTDIQMAFENRVKINTQEIGSVIKKQILRTEENGTNVVITTTDGKTIKRRAEADKDIYDVITINDKSGNILQEIVMYPIFHSNSGNLIEVRTYIDENTVVGIEYDRDENINRYYERSRKASNYNGYISDLYRYNIHGFLTDMCEVLTSGERTIVKTLQSNEYRITTLNNNNPEKEVVYDCTKNKKTEFYFEGDKKRKLYTINTPRKEIQNIQKIKNPPKVEDIANISFCETVRVTKDDFLLNSLQAQEIKESISKSFEEKIYNQKKLNKPKSNDNSDTYSRVPKTLDFSQDMFYMLNSYGKNAENPQAFLRYENFVRSHFRKIVELLNTKEDNHFVYTEREVLTILRHSIDNPDFLDVITHRNQDGCLSIKYSIDLARKFISFCSKYKYQILNIIDKDETLSVSEIMDKVSEKVSYDTVQVLPVNVYNSLLSDLKLQTINGKQRFSTEEIKHLTDLYTKYDTSIINKKSILDDLLHFGQYNNKLFTYDEIEYMLTITSAHIKEEQINAFKLFKALKNEGIENIVSFIKRKNDYIIKSAAKCKDVAILAKIIKNIGVDYVTLKTPDLLVDMYEAGSKNFDFIHDLILMYKENEIRSILNYLLINDINKIINYQSLNNARNQDINSRRMTILKQLGMTKDQVSSDIF